MTEKRALLVRALTALGERIAKAPRKDCADGFGADSLLATLLDNDEGPLMVTVERDPTASDGLIDYCRLCEGSPHDASCPVGVLEALAKVGVDTDTPLPANVGLVAPKPKHAMHCPAHPLIAECICGAEAK